MDDFDRRYAAALEEAKQSGILPFIADPLRNKLARKFGLKFKPPLYSSFWNNALAEGVWVAALWALIIQIFFWGEEVLSTSRFFAMLIILGVFIGITNAFFIARRKKRHELSDWEAL